MKKMPLILLIFLMLLIVISGMTDSVDMQQYPDERQEQSDVFFNPPFDMKEPHKDERVILYIVPYSSPVNEKVFLADNIEKSEEMIKRLDGAIARLNKEGKDTGELEQMVDNYAFLVSDAKKYLSLAENSSVSSDEQQYLELSRENIVRANSELKPIFDKVKTYLTGPVSISDNSSLVAEGSGVAILAGDIDVSFFLSDGKFSVIDFAKDLAIDMEHDYKQEVIPERGEAPDLIMPQKMVSYVEVTGNVSLSGSSFSVAIMADNISLVATGTGEAELVGNGTYYLDYGTFKENESVWIKSIFESD